MNNEKVIPILPCPDVKTQAAFFQQLGFELKGLYTSPNPYLAVQLGSLELHFWGSKKIVPKENASMCFLRVEDVDAVCETFTVALKKATGKIPRSGIPRISKMRDLKDDRRFTLTDVGGNTFFIGSPAKDNFFRTLSDEKFAKGFSVLYDVVYSKEDSSLAFTMLTKYNDYYQLPDAIDRARFLLLVLEIRQQLKQPVEGEGTALKEMIAAHPGAASWNRISEKYLAILQED